MTGDTARLPDFFVVGHAKSGTTALYEMLRRHPEIYMPDLKEPWFFASDMRPRFQPPRAGVPPQTLDDYRELFAAARPGQRVGEASSSYLWSRTAAQRIAEVRPEAQIIALAVPLGIVFVQATGSGVFSRYESLTQTNPTTSCKDCKRGVLKHIPHQISVAPFGVGLGSVAAAGGFGGKPNPEEVQKLSGETQYSFLTDEVGAPGLLLWTAFMFTLIGLSGFRLRRIEDPEMRIWLAAISAPLIAMVIMGTSGLVSASGTFGPYLWFAAGTCAYWLAGPGLTRPPGDRIAAPGNDPRLVPAGSAP